VRFTTFEVPQEWTIERGSGTRTSWWASLELRFSPSKETLQQSPQTDTYQPMVHALLDHGAVSEIPSIRDKYLQAYRLMVLARVLDDKFASLYRMGKIHGGVFLGRGQEALSVSIGLGLW